MKERRLNHTKEDLKQLQKLPLSAKIKLTEIRIREWVQEFGLDKVYVSFSGGKDSTVLLDICRRLFPDILGVFIDTGLEYPEVRQHVKTVENIHWLYPVKYDRHKRQYVRTSFKEVITKYGYPVISKEVSQKIHEARSCPDGKVAMRFEPNNPHTQKYDSRYSMERWKWLRDSDIPISNQCCNVMKKRPAKLFERETGRKPIIATMTEESGLRQSAWIKDGCNAFDAKRPTSKPMSFWTEQDVLQYIVENKLAYPSIYGDIIKNPDTNRYETTGLDRTGCVFCMFGVHREKEPNRFQRLKITHPQLWEYCMKPVEDGGLGLKEVLKTINVSIE